MIVIHLARKPLAGTVAKTVLKHGTGGLNIDRTRLRYTSARDKTPEVGSVDRAHRNPGCGSDLPGYKQNWGQWKAKEGRFPANLLLEHLLGCCMTGTEQVAGYVINRFDDGAKPFGGGAGHPYTSEEQGEETVEVWSCAPGCPVAAMDAASGLTDSGGASRYFKQVQGEPEIIRASGAVICGSCSRAYRDHPVDAHVTDQGGEPFLHVLCDGTRVKL